MEILFIVEAEEAEKNTSISPYFKFLKLKVFYSLIILLRLQKGFFRKFRNNSE
jgi:hypothetical protein